MEGLVEILKYIGFPAIIGSVIWLVRLEAKVKTNIDKIDDMYKLKTVNDNKLDSLIEKLTENVNALTIVTSKHDIILESIKDSISTMHEDIKTRPCISHGRSVDD